MPKFLFQAKYNVEGAQGLQKEKGTGREKSLSNAFASVGGKLEAVYFTLGEHDIIAIADLPDHITAASLAIASAAGGAATVHTILLLTPQEIDQALDKPADYRPPGA